MAMKVQGGQMVPANNIIRSTAEAKELNRLLIDAASTIARAGIAHERLKRVATQSPEFMQQLRQVELNLDTALSNIQTAQRAINKPF